MNNNEFHEPFLKSLVFIGAVTIVSLVFAHFYVPKIISSYKNSPQYTSSPSYNQAQAGE